MEALPRERSAEQETIAIQDPAEARDFIRRRIEEEHDMPVITVPRIYLKEARNGLRPHATWIYEDILAGTLGREPYEMGPERVAFRVKISSDQVEPRFTGPDKCFHGVVVFIGPIPPDKLEELAS